MPVKLRQPKRRRDDEAEAESWSTLFASSYDYFGDLDFANEDDARKAARAAWRRFGSRFMDKWRAAGKTTEPWALARFGMPATGRGRR